MNRRLLLALGGLCLLLLLSGCMGFGQSTSDAGLAEEAAYDWGQDVDVSVDLDDRQYTAVYHIENVSELRVYQSTRYGTEHPVSVRAVQFKHTNGTVVNASEIAIRETRSAVYIAPPADEGELAYTAPKQSKSFTTPVTMAGSWEVTIPEDHRVDNRILGTVRPGGSEQTVEDTHVTVRWNELSSGTVRIEYYLARDVYLFLGLLGAAALAGGGGIAYVYREMIQLRKRRSELGLDLDDGDDEGGWRPPGFR